MKKLFEHERIFKLNSATLHNNKIVKIILIAEAHAYDKYLNDELMQKMENIVREILPDIFDFEIIYRKTYTEEKYVLKSILDFVYTEYPTIFSFFKRQNRYRNKRKCHQRGYICGKIHI